MEIRDFNINLDSDNIVEISQINPEAENGQDSIFLSIEQIDFFIDILNKTIDKKQPEKKTMYTALMEIKQDGFDCGVSIRGETIENLLEEKQHIYDCFIDDVGNIPYQRDETKLTYISKIKYIEEE